MKTEPPDLDRSDLARVLSAEYGIEAASLTFVPKGEDAAIYLTPGNAPVFFVRAQRRERAVRLDDALRGAAFLRGACEIEEILAAIPARSGGFICQCGGYVVVVFPYIRGVTAFESEFSETRLARAARFLARLHECAAPPVPLPQERFENPFAPAILRALEQAKTESTGLSALLLAERDDLIETLARMERWKETLARLDCPLVTIHGDPNLDNLLFDENEHLFVTDWGELGTGPAERDLFAFTGPKFQIFLAHYCNTRRAKINRHSELFSFYFYRWSLQEIADYSARLLDPNASRQEAAHAWHELREYLPLRHASIAGQVAAAMLI